MRGRWNRIYLQEADSFRIAHSNRFGIGDLVFGKRHAFAQNPLFLFGCPFRRQREQCFKFLLRELLIHIEKPKQDSGRTMLILPLWTSCEL